MKKKMKIVKHNEQVRTTIPKGFVEEFNVTTKDNVEWDNKNKKLTGRFVKDVQSVREKKE